MKTYRAALTIGGAVAVLVGAVGCTSGDGDAKAEGASPSTKTLTCDASGFAWSGTRREIRLTGTSDLLHYSGKGELVAVVKDGDQHYAPNVSGTSARLSAAQVIKALGTHLKTAQPLAGPGEMAVTDTQNAFHDDTGQRRGAYYAWNSVTVVTADFTHPCAVGNGHVVTWETTGTGLLSCANRVTWTAGDEKDQATARVIHEAAVKVCPEGSGATRAPREAV
ncbi:hypothetical protein ACFVT5_04575 [Streptomyces sp. NPDC058001]|uniref:hypothetical protein n=1 Tax=Streptomyces sp. NPDC058001 TaxID=3346300 RepID=UPI0036ED9675